MKELWPQNNASHEGKTLSHMHPGTHGVVAYVELLFFLLDEVETMPELAAQ